MSRKHIDFPTLVQVVNDMGDVFTTKDVSEDPRTKSANQQYLYHSHYHAFVGGALSDHRAELNIIEIQKGTTRGSRWQKAGSLYGENNLDNFSGKSANKSINDSDIYPAKEKQNSKVYAIEQINREIYALNSKIEKLQKDDNGWGCGCTSISVGAFLIIVGIGLLIVESFLVAIVIFIISLLLFIVGFISFTPSPQIKSLQERIKILEEKKKRLY